MRGKGKSLRNSPHSTASGTIVRKQGEQVPQRAGQDLRATVPSSLDAIAILNSDGTIRYESPSIERILGYKPEELVGKTILEFIHPDDIPNAANTFEVSATNPGQPISMEVRFQHKDGSWRLFEGVGNNLLDDPQVNGIVINYRDITGHRQDQETSQSQEEYFRALIENSLDAISVLNVDGTVRYQSPSFERILGFNPEEVIGKSTLDLAHPEDKSKATGAFSQLLHHPRSTIQVELRAQHKDGSWRTLEIRGNNLLDDSTVKGIVINYRDITEQKQMEMELRESEEKLKRYLEGSPDVICVTDLKGTILYINEAGERLTGYPKKEIVGQNFLKVGLLSPRHVSKPAQWIEAGGAEKEFRPEEYEVIRKDGSRVSVEVSTLSICPGEDVNKTEIIGIVRDISERKQMQESLLIKGKAIENSLNAIAMSDMEGKITYVNKSCLSLWGNDNSEEIIGKPYLVLLNADEVQISTEIVQAIFEKGFWEGELSAVNRDGKQIYVQIATGLIKDDEGNPIQTISSFIDITERKMAEEALRESEANYSALIANVPDAVFKYVEGQIVWGNDVMEKILGYTKDEMINRNVNLFLPDDLSVPDITRTVYPVLKEQGNFHGTTTAKRKNGEIAHIEYSASQVPDKDPVEIVGVARDVTERIQAEQEREQLTAELAEKNREQEQIIYVTSHDLRSPLVNVQGFSKELGYSLNELASVLQTENVSQDVREKLQSILETDIGDALEYIKTSISKMDLLLSGLLRLSRLGRAALTFEHLNMNTLLSDIQKAFEYRIKESGVSVVIGDLPPCIGDAVQINQVFSNLLDNALKYLDQERPGTIKITGEIEGNMSAYCVEDNGIGIAGEHQSKIFEIFHRLNPCNTGGDGLGLSIIRKILSRHSGKIWVESEPGIGSKFFISLPGIE